MWTREELKTNAKGVLRRTYWMGFAVCLVAGFIGSGGGGGASAYYQVVLQLNDPILYMIMGAFMVFGMLLSIFVGIPIMVGKNDYFMSSREYDPSFTKLFSSFAKGKANYFNIVKVMFLYNLYILFWTLLFIIPGIIKSFEYFFVPYILSENPSISAKRAIQISRNMTRGYKFDIFILGVSFIGWQLLGMLACCIGVIFVTPYIEATFAELYAAHRARALAEGFADSSELCGY